jgi:TonB family protein
MWKEAWAMRMARSGLAVTAAALLLAGCTTPEEQAREALDAGAQALERADRAGAVAELTRATELDPSLASAWALLADAQLQGEFWAAARDAARRAAELEPRSAAHQELIGRACGPLEAWTDARAAFSRALELDPARAPLHYELARVQERLEAPDAALAEYRQALEAGVEPLRTRLALARLALASDDQREARRLLDEAAALPGEPPGDARTQLAELREDLTAREEAVRQEEATVAEQRERVEREAPSPGLLRILGSLGSSGDGAVADVLRSGDVDSDLDEALRGVQGVGVASSGAAGQRGGNGSGSAGGVLSDLHGPVGAGVTRPPPRPEAVVALGTPTVTGGDPAAVSRAFSSQRGRFRSCYEMRLAANPTITGRLTLRVAADDQGAVTSVSASSSTVHDAELESCVVNGIRRLSFPPAQSAAGWSITQPFEFSSSQP